MSRCYSEEGTKLHTAVEKVQIVNYVNELGQKLDIELDIDGTYAVNGPKSEPLNGRS